MVVNKSTSNKEDKKMASNSNGAPKVIGMILVIAICLLGTYSSQTTSLQTEQLNNMREDVSEVQKAMNIVISENSLLRENNAKLSEGLIALREYAKLRLDDQKEHIVSSEYILRIHVSEYEKANAIVREKVNNIERAVFNKDIQ